MGPTRPDGLTVEDRFFLSIALKNGLVEHDQAERVAHALRAGGGGGAADAAVRLGVLDPAQVQRVREAMAASQVVRLDSVYADLAVAQGLVPRAAVEAAFAEQRRQRFRVRIGTLLQEQGALTAEGHRRLVSLVIRRLEAQGPDAYASSVVRRSAEAEQANLGSTWGPRRAGPGIGASDRLAQPDDPLRRTPPAAISLQSSEEDPLPPAALTAPPLGPDSAWLTSNIARLRQPLEETAEVPPGGGVRGWSASGSADDPLVASAVEMATSSAEIDVSAGDRAALSRELAETGSAESSFVLDRIALSGSEPDGRFQVDRYLQSRRLRRRSLAIAAGGVLLAALTVGGVTLATRLGNRGLVAEAEALLDEAGRERDPARRADLFARAAERVNQAGSLGVSEDERADLQARARWGGLESEALGALAAGEPLRARGLLESRTAEVPPSARAAWQELLQRAAREHDLQNARRAEERGDLVAAVLDYRRVQAQRDPTGEAEARLLAIRSRLQEELARARDQVLGSLAERDETAYSRVAKQMVELFNENPGHTEVLDEVAFRRALRQADDLLGQGDLPGARAALEQARRLRPDHPRVLAGLEEAGKRARLLEAEEQGRAAERERRLRDALERYEQARALATRPADRTRLDEALERCRRELGRIDVQLERRRRLEAAIASLRASRPDEALAALEALAAETPGDARVEGLLALARRVRGMVYVPGGPFRMGTAPDEPGKALERPQHERQVAAFFIDRTEVTNEQFARFLAAAGTDLPPPPHWTYPVPRGDGTAERSYDPVIADHPVTNVTWAEARAYARWRGASLPGEAQWERAARGTDGRTFPWGASRQVRVHVQSADPLARFPTAPVGGHGDDLSPCGALDMAGNVGEWTADDLVPYPGAPPDARPAPGRKVIRGGAWKWPLDDARCACRDGAEPDYRHPTVGFRVAIEVPPALTDLR